MRPLTTLARWFGAALGACAIGVNTPIASSPVSLQQQLPRFTTGVDLVRVDVAVIDNKTGRAVPGLTRDDFTLRESGTYQRITAFLADGTTPAAAAGVDTRTSARRVFLIVLGGGDHSGPVRPYDGVIGFLEKHLRPPDVVALMALNRVTEFTTEYSRLVPIVERLRNATKTLAPLAMQDLRDRLDISVETQAVIDAVFKDSDGLALPIRSATALLAGTSEYQVNDDRWRAWNRMIAGRDILKAAAGIELLRTMDGEKHLVLLTRTGIAPLYRILHEQGLGFDSADHDRDFAERASEAGVAVDIIKTTPPQTFSAARFSGAVGGHLLTRQSQNVSEYSGGQFTSLRTAADQLGRIDDATRNGYVLGYQPTNTVLDGKHRDIVVTANRRNVTVLHRRGYIARRERSPVEARALIADTRLGEAAASDLTFDEIKVVVVATVSAPRQVRVDLRIEAGKLNLGGRSQSSDNQLDVLILVGDSGGTLVGQRRERIVAGGEGVVSQIVTVPVTKGASVVKVIVYDGATDSIGATTAKVK